MLACAGASRARFSGTITWTIRSSEPYRPAISDAHSTALLAVADSSVATRTRFTADLVPRGGTGGMIASRSPDPTGGRRRSREGARGPCVDHEAALRHRPIHFEREREYPMSVKEAWRLLADTDHLNRTIGLPAVTFSSPDGAGGQFARQARAGAFGMGPWRLTAYPLNV